MNIKKLLATAILLTSPYVMATEGDISELQAEREHVIHQYILDLGKADSQDIITLFNEEGTVISTSRGLVNARDFFNAFLPEIETASTIVHQTFNSKEDTNHYAARFHFSFKLKHGETGDGEYVDEFVFAPDSAKLTQVSMFENLKFNDK